MRKDANFLLRNEAGQFPQFISANLPACTGTLLSFFKQSRYGVKTKIIVTFHYKIT